MTTARALAPAPLRRPDTRRDTRRDAPRHLRVVPRSSRRRATRALVVGAAVLTLVAIFGLVTFNVFLVQSQFELERIEQQVDAERQEYERLRLEAARLSSPERILDLARSELGMVDPEGVTHLTAPASGSQEGAPPGGARSWAEVKPFLAAEP